MNFKKYLEKAQKGKWAIGQFNFSTLEQLRAIFEAVRAAKSPVILGTSEGESRFLGLEEVTALVRVLEKKYDVPAFLNLDHGKDISWIKKAVDSGYPAVHFDGSDLPIEENIRIAKEIAHYAHKKGVLAEGELGFIGGESKYHEGRGEFEEKNLTLPEQVARFVKETKVDSLAISIGNIHGFFQEKPKLDLERLKKIRGQTNAFLVLHGGSVISGEEIKRAIEEGIVKVNFNTELRLAWREALENFFSQNPDELKPYKALADVQISIQKKVEEKILLLNSQNNI